MAIGYRQTIKIFRNNPKALLDILEFIKEYNLWIYSINITN